MKNHVPFDVAFEMDPITRGAFSIVFSEMEGAVFDWSIMQFKKSDS